LPDGHRVIADCLYTLAEVRHFEHHDDVAAALYQAAIAAYEKAGPSGSAALPVVLHQYANLLKLRNPEEARSLEKRSQTLRKSLQ
jgi:hypothetical protein